MMPRKTLLCVALVHFVQQITSEQVSTRALTQHNKKTMMMKQSLPDGQAGNSIHLPVKQMGAMMQGEEPEGTP